MGAYSETLRLYLEGAQVTRYLAHVTLDTGDVHRSPRSEVEAETIPVVSRLLSLALYHEAAHWLGDLERCIAWCWIDMRRTDQ